MRNPVLKASAVGVLAALAILCAVLCARSFRRPEAAPVSYDGAEAQFVLRDYRGYVSVFAPSQTREPVQITAIRTDSLRRADQRLLENGLTVGSREQLILLLEDFSG
ncbi:MAG: hypothetical protein ILP09_03000 [Oscillospiraceae bacterium]|nr:hypothetical protein [Oscillospiraceae bacterium]